MSLNLKKNCIKPFCDLYEVSLKERHNQLCSHWNPKIQTTAASWDILFCFIFQNIYTILISVLQEKRNKIGWLGCDKNKCNHVLVALPLYKHPCMFVVLND